MARRKPTRGRKKIQPAPLTMVFAWDLQPGEDDLQTLDLSQCASIINRRFYRQGINWAVRDFKFLTTSGVTGEFSISKLPNTWVMSNSWEKSFRTWTKMNNEALAETQSVRPKFLDFKVYADEYHHAAGPAANLLPFNYTPGEWEYSKISVPLVSPAGAFNPGDTVERELIAVGASYPGNSPVTGFNAVSLIEGYAASRGLPNIADPNTPSDAPDIGGGTPENWMQAIFNEGTDQAADVLEDMISENNIAPYPFENDGTHLDTMYPGGANQASFLEIHDAEKVTGTTIGGTTRLKGGNFPCGLIRIHSTNVSEATTVVLYLSLVPGDHRGYLCEPMTEM